MAVPRQRADWAERVVVAVETSAGSGAFEVDDRLRADVVEMLSDGQIARAELSVRLDDSFSAADAASCYHPDRRIVVRTEESVLFDGYPNVDRLDWRSKGNVSTGHVSTGARNTWRGREFGLTLEHVVGRLGRDVRAQIIGRHVRDGVIVDGLSSDPSTWSGSSVLVTGLPCIFNLGGVGNCDPEPIEVDDGSGGVRKVHIFSDDLRSDATDWTYARVLRYLLHFYVWSGCPIDVTDVLDQTDDVAPLASEGREAFLESDRLAYALLGRPDTLVLEATSLVEALTLVSAASGLHLTAQSLAAGQEVRTRWRVWSEWGDSQRELRLAPSGRDESGNLLYDTSSVRAVELFHDNNVSSTTIRWDSSETASSALVVGDLKRYRVTVELVPGWLPVADLDNVSAPQRAAAKAKALTEELILAMGSSANNSDWYRSYHRDGADFGANRDVGRKWVLNEAGTYNGAQYARNAPFDSYAPFDFSAVWDGRWMRRRRRFVPVSLSPEEPARIRVEVSFDSGGSWLLVDAGYSVLAEECGIWFDVPNLLSIAPPGEGAETNLWYALIDQTCRVRVTAVIESDDRLMVEESGDWSPTLFRHATVLYAPQRFGFLRHVDGPNGTEAVIGSNTSTDRDDLATMRMVAATMASERGSRAVMGRATIPWLDEEYSIGDRILGVRGRGVRFDTQRAPSRRHACVVGKRYRFDHGRFETELILSSVDSADTGSGMVG